MENKKSSKIIFNLSYYKKRRLDEICKKNNINFASVFETFVDRFIKETDTANIKEKVFENTKNEFTTEELIKKINRWAHSKSSLSNNMITAFIRAYHVSDCSYRDKDFVSVDSFFESYHHFPNNEKIDKNTFISRLKQMCSNSLSARGKIFIRCGKDVSLNPEIKQIVISLYNDGYFQDEFVHLQA